MKKTVTALLFAICMLTGVHITSASTIGFTDVNDNRTLVPIRFISEQLGASVTWEQKQQRIIIEKGETAILLAIGSNKATINNEPKTLEVAPMAEKGTTYVPLRFVSEAFGVSPIWRAETLSVEINLNEKTLIIPVAPRTFIDASQPEIQRKTENYSFGKKSVNVNALLVDAKNENISLDIAIANDTVGSVEALDSMAKRNKAIAAVNGSFFDAYTDSGFKTPYGFIIKDGKQHNRGDDRAVFWFDEKGYSVISTGSFFKEYIQQASPKGALQAGPTLVKNGEIYLDPKKEGHNDPKILTMSGARSAIGIDRNQNVIIATANNATIPELARIMINLGAYSAMNLDGGASSGLYYNGQYITKPGRLISNALLIKR